MIYWYTGNKTVLPQGEQREIDFEAFGRSSGNLNNNHERNAQKKKRIASSFPGRAWMTSVWSFKRMTERSKELLFSPGKGWFFSRMNTLHFFIPATLRRGIRAI